MKKLFSFRLFSILFAVLTSLLIVSFLRPEIKADDDFAVISSSEDFIVQDFEEPQEPQEPEAIPLSSLSLKNSSMTYTGTPRTQNSGITVTAVVDGQQIVLARWTDYNISYSDNTEIGIAKVTVSGRGLYTGTLTKTFKILPAKTTISSLEAQTRRIIVRWKTPPACADGVQVQYSTKSDFSADCAVSMVRNTQTLSRTITNLTAGKTYYVRVRSYKKADGKNFYSAYSKVLSVKLVKNSLTAKKTSDGKRTLILDNAPLSAKTIRFAVWSGRFGQDDLVWYEAQKLSNGRWKASFSVAKHRNDGKFYVDIYSNDQYQRRTSFKTDVSETATAYTALAESLEISGEADQLILVGASRTSCNLTMLNKNSNGTWHQLISTSGNVGLNGIGEVTEWNRKTPVGVYGFCKAFGIYDDPGTKLKYTKVDSSYYWVDDVNSKYYNKFVTTKTTPVSWSSAEHIIDYTGSYQYCLALDFNKECVPGAGSAIFLHAGSGDPTLGCIAVPLDQMKKIMQYVIPGCKIIIDTPKNLKKY